MSGCAFEIPYDAPSLNAQLRRHYASGSRARRIVRLAASASTRAALGLAIHGLGRELGVRVTLTRLGLRKLDSDNLQGAMKVVRDGVADGLGTADNAPWIEWVYGQERVTLKRHTGVRVLLELRSLDREAYRGSYW